MILEVTVRVSLRDDDRLIPSNPTVVGSGERDRRLPCPDKEVVGIPENASRKCVTVAIEAHNRVTTSEEATERSRRSPRKARYQVCGPGRASVRRSVDVDPDRSALGGRQRGQGTRWRSEASIDGGNHDIAIVHRIDGNRGLGLGLRVIEYLDVRAYNKSGGRWRPQRRGGHNDNQESQRSEEHTSELQSPCNLVCRLLLEKKNNKHC